MIYENMDKTMLIDILKEKDNTIKKLSLEKKRLNYYAATDGMTEVLNRRYGLELLNKELHLSQASDKNLVVCFVDVDRLKIINDMFGHEEGDKLLINIAKILKESIRRTDFVIRMGGDEFLIVFPKTTMKDVNKVWKRICRRVAEEKNYEKGYTISLSYGFSEYGKGNYLSVNELINNADMEMYKEKLKKCE